MNSEQSLAKKLTPDKNTAAYFVKRLTDFGGDLAELGRELAAALDERRELYTELVDAGIPRELITRLERAGRGMLLPELFFPRNSMSDRLSSMPASVQRLALEDGVEVWDQTARETRKIPVDSIAPEQCRQVCDGNRLRDVAEQRTWCESQSRKDLPVNGDRDYFVKKGYVVTKKPGKWTKALILQWLSEMG